MRTHAIDDPPNWKVLLIGGHSGTGKTVVARQLARRYGVGLAEVDDFRLVLERVTTPEQQPAIHSLLQVCSDPDASPEAACEALIEVAKVMAHALEIVVAHHLHANTPVILDGDGIVPSFAALDAFADRDAEDLVRAVFIIETDEAQLHRNAIARGRGFEQCSPDYQHRTIRRSWLYGQWLQREAARFGVPVVASRPWETLEERVIIAIG